MRLSVLDLCPTLSGATASQALRNALELARHVEDLGYRRYWFAEHHAMTGIASSSPEILIGHVAQVTEKLRVGSGGIMLPNHAPLKVAESFRTLEALHPGRIDLGLGRAPGSGARATVALRGRDGDLRAEHFPEHLQELIDYLSDTSSLPAVPTGVGMPELWILGSSDFGAKLAGDLGLPFAFAQHFSSLPARAVFDLYRDRFKPSRFLDRPRTIVASHVICGETDERARELARSTEYSWFNFRQTGKSEPLLSLAELEALRLSADDWDVIASASMAKFVGSPASLGPRLQEFVREVGADELMVMTMIHAFEDRKQSYSLLAGALQ